MIVTDNFNAKQSDPGTKVFNRPKAFFDQWQEGEGIPIYNLFHVEDMTKAELGHWERFGCDGAFVNLADPFITPSMIIEIAPGGKTKPVQHMFETWCFVVDGDGETVISQAGCPANTVSWGGRAVRAARMVVPPAFQHRCCAGALSRAQARRQSRASHPPRYDRRRGSTRPDRIRAGRALDL